MKRKILNRIARGRMRSGSILLLLWVASGSASAFILQPADVVSSYGACSWKSNGNGTSTITMTVTFKKPPVPQGVVFISRSLLIYTYDKSGKPKPSSAAAYSVALNNMVATDTINISSGGYVMYAYYPRTGSITGPDNPWLNRGEFTGTYEVKIKDAMVEDWPAVALRPGIYTYADDIGEKSGAAYVDLSTNGSCKIRDPDVPPPEPPPSVVVDVVAPDWSLGELPHGESEKTLGTTAEQLCFTYSGFGAADASEQFVIDAESENGVSNNRFRLKNVDKPTQTIPYSVTLGSGSATFSLPNGSKTSVKMNKDKRTCFVPTFKTSVGIDADEGDYNDVLTFTVVTKS